MNDCEGLFISFSSRKGRPCLGSLYIPACLHIKALSGI